jgi:hypothetical protein
MKKNNPNFDDEKYGNFFKPDSDNIIGVDSVQYEALANLLKENVVDEELSNYVQSELVKQLRERITGIDLEEI